MQPLSKAIFEDEPAWVDVNGDGVVNVSDVTTLIDQLLAGD